MGPLIPLSPASKTLGLGGGVGGMEEEVEEEEVVESSVALVSVGEGGKGRLGGQVADPGGPGVKGLVIVVLGEEEDGSTEPERGTVQDLLEASTPSLTE